MWTADLDWVASGHNNSLNTIDRLEAELAALPSWHPKRDWLERALETARSWQISCPGTVVAHYTASWAAIFRSKKLRATAFSQMRDPRESKPWVFLESSPIFVPGTLSDEKFGVYDLDKAHEAARVARQDSTKILCLTKEAADAAPPYEFRRAYARPRMWNSTPRVIKACVSSSTRSV
jgi:hypothetical protein